MATTNALNDTGTKMNAQTKDTTKNNRRVHEGEMFVVGEFYASSETFRVIIIMIIMKGTTNKTQLPSQTMSVKRRKPSKKAGFSLLLVIRFYMSALFHLASIYIASQYHTQGGGGGALSAVEKQRQRGGTARAG